jgi:RNA polymerase sigma factor (TIGR02999 family)
MDNGQITMLLGAVHQGDSEATAELFEVTYAKLRRLATCAMRRQRSGHTLQPTALINQAVVNILASDCLIRTANRGMFFALATRAMRSVLVDHARRRAAAKRVTGQGRRKRLLDEVVSQFERLEQVDLLALDEVLKQLEALNKRQHDTVMLRFFGGLRFQEIADHQGVSLSTVEKDWNFARAWLRRALDKG